MPYFRAALSICLLAVAGVACATDISGTYVGLYSNAADLMQIVERPDGSILGRFEEVILTESGTGINRMNASVSGAVGGNTVALTIKPAEFMGGTIPVSGTIDGDTLRLSGGANGGNFDAVMQRSTESEFTKQEQRLIAEANHEAILQSAKKTVARNRKNIAQVTERMREISRGAAIHIKRLANAPATCGEFTKRMESALAREEYFPARSYARSQLDYAVSSVDFYSNLWHDDLQRVELSYGYSNGKIDLSKSLADQIATARASCGALGWGVSLLCKNFFVAQTHFQSTESLLEAEFAAAESAWHSEHAKQNVIHQKADALNISGL